LYTWQDDLTQHMFSEYICCQKDLKHVDHNTEKFEIRSQNQNLSLMFWIVKNPLHPTEFFKYDKLPSIAPVSSTPVIAHEAKATDVDKAIPEIICAWKK